jgi:uncharacterized integral membrane protein (TIGR00698 family)
LSLVLAGAAFIISQRYGAPAMLMGLLLGLAFHFLSDSERFVEGLAWASGPCLRFGVALLGLRLSMGEVLVLGWGGVLWVAAAVVATLLFGVLWARILRCDASLGILTGGAVAICGASAAMAIGAVLPDSEHRQRHTLFTVIGVTSLSTVAMIFYPIVGDYLGFSEADVGYFIGATIHDVAQVVGAGYSVSAETGDLATFVKLIRVAMLVPIVIVIGIVFRRVVESSPGKSVAAPVVPLFLVGFIALFALNNLGVLPSWPTRVVADSATLLLLLAVTALGVRTSLREVVSIGWRPVALLGGETLFLAVLVASFILFGRA